MARPVFQTVDPLHEGEVQREHVAVPTREILQQFPLWLSTVQAQQFIPCKSLKATYEWLRSHGIERRGNGSVLRTDIERELARLARRPRRRMAAASLANLRRRSKGVAHGE